MIKGGKNNQIISFCECMRSLLKAFLPIEMIKGKVLQNMFTLHKYAHCSIEFSQQYRAYITVGVYDHPTFITKQSFLTQIMLNSSILKINISLTLK